MSAAAETMAPAPQPAATPKVEPLVGMWMAYHGLEHVDTVRCLLDAAYSMGKLDGGIEVMRLPR